MTVDYPPPDRGVSFLNKLGLRLLRLRLFGVRCCTKIQGTVLSTRINSNINSNKDHKSSQRPPDIHKFTHFQSKRQIKGRTVRMVTGRRLVNGRITLDSRDCSGGTSNIVSKISRRHLWSKKMKEFLTEMTILLLRTTKFFINLCLLCLFLKI